jgi:hypothetical protein
MAGQNELNLGELEVQEHRIEQKKQKDAIVFKAINVAMDMLSDKALLMLVTVVAALFFGYALYEPTPMKTVVACLFTGMVHWPVLFRYMRKK